MTGLKLTQSPDGCQGSLFLSALRAKGWLERDWNKVFEWRWRRRGASRHVKAPHRPMDADGVWICRRRLTDCAPRGRWENTCSRYSRVNPLTHGVMPFCNKSPGPGGARSSHDGRCHAEQHE